MKTLIDKAVLVKARDAAEGLKQQLLSTLNELKQKRHPAIDFNAKILDIQYPDPMGIYADQIGLFYWTVLFQDACARKKEKPYTYRVSLDGLIPRSVLFPLFRQVFEPIGLPVCHPQILGYYTKICQLCEFIGSAQKVNIANDQALFIRPTVNIRQACWQEAEIRIDSGFNLPNQSKTKMLAACNIDPFGLHYGVSVPFGKNCKSPRYEIGEYGVSKQLTFYVHVTGEKGGVPLAQLVGFDPATGTHAFELAQGVNVNWIAGVPHKS